jgi:hypothetical protein
MGDLLFETRREIVDGGAEAIFTGGRGWGGLSASRPRPFLVLLYGPPGSGKSSALTQEVIEKGLGLGIDGAAKISLDSLVESLVPFRRATAGLWRQVEEGEDPVNKMSGKAGAVYLNYMKRTGNNSVDPVAKKGPLPDLIAVRNAGLEEAMKKELDILFEMVISSAEKDKVGEEIFSRLKALGKLDKYDVYVVYPWVRQDVLEERMRTRPHKQMKEEEPFFRGVSPKLAGRFIQWHREYLQNFIFPRCLAEDIIGYRLLGSGARPRRDNNSDDSGLLGHVEKVIIFNNTASSGGGRRRTARKRSHRRRTKRS